MCTTLHYSFSTKAFGLAIFFKAILASSKVAFVAFNIPSLEIPSC
jgi:dihydrodipicolinate synthase/N-acetylneuraminate lyase